MIARRSLCLFALLPLLVSMVFVQSTNGQAASSEPAPSPIDTGTGRDSTVPPSTSEAMAEAEQAINKAEKGGAGFMLAAQRAAQLTDYVLNQKREGAQAKVENARAMFVRGRVLLLQGRMRDALAYLKEYAASEGKADWLCCKLLGDIYFQGKYYEMSLQSYKEAGRLNSRESKVFLGWARAELALNKREEAAKHAQQAIDLDAERDPEPHLLLAQTQLQLQKFAEAVVTARRAIDLTRDRLRQEPGQEKWLKSLDNALSVMMEIDQTRLERNPEQGDIYVSLAQVAQDRADLARLMAYHEAIRTLEQGLEKTAPNTPPEVMYALLYETARLQYAVGRDEDARAILDVLLEKQPDHAEARKLRDKIPSTAPAQ